MKNLYLSYFLFYSIIASSETILCELKGTFEETSEVPKTNYLQDVGDAIKNFTTSAYTGFLVQVLRKDFERTIDLSLRCEQGPLQRHSPPR